MKKNKNGPRFSGSFNLSVWFCILLGALLLSVYTVLCILDYEYTYLFGIGFLVLYLIAATVSLILRQLYHNSRVIHRQQNVAMSMVMAETIKTLQIPFVISDEVGKIIWYNRGFSTMINNKSSLFGEQLSEYCQISPEELVKSNTLVADFSVDSAPEDSYVTDYRAFKGQEWPDAELCIDLEDLLEELTGMYPEFFEPDECVMFEA